MKRYFPLWQITLPLCGVLMFAIGSFTTIYMVNGRYIFDLDFSPKQLKVRTDIDKREGNQSDDITQQKTIDKIDQFKSVY
jgi:hypothetical protein